MKKLISLLTVFAFIFLQSGMLLSEASVQVPLDIIGFVADEASEYGYADYRLVNSNGQEVNLSEGIFVPQKSALLSARAVIPTAYDSRNANCITDVKYQGASGNCWAFSSMSMLETDSILQGLDDIETADYSEAHMSWFNAKSLTENTDDPTYGDGTDGEEPYMTGGNWITAAASLARWSGPAEEADYPFKPDDLSLMGNYGEENRYDTGSGIVIKSAEQLLSMADVKQWIIDHGSATVAFYYDDAYVNNSSAGCAYYYNGENTLNHQITIVGWDNSYSADNFNSTCQPSGNGAWLCKNSWSKYWGDSGYFWLSYYDTSLQYFAGFTSQSADKYDNNYTYNGAGWIGAVEHTGAAQLANVFTAKGYETLSAVSTYTVNTDVTISVSVYKDLPSDFSDPDEGTLSSTVTVTKERLGYHTIELIDEVALEPGSIFAVVVELSCSTGTVYIPVEADNNTGTVYSSNAGESYMNLPAYNNGWYDAQAYGMKNMMIQAFTKCDHRFVTIEIPSTCINEGSEKTACSQCGLVTSEENFLISSHNFGQWSAYEDVSETTDKCVSTRSCTVCGLTESKSYIAGNVVDIDDLLEILFERMVNIIKMIFIGLRGA